MNSDFAESGRPYNLYPVNIGVGANYWRFIVAPGGADKTQH